VRSNFFLTSYQYKYFILPVFLWQGAWWWLVSARTFSVYLSYVDGGGME